MFLSCQPRKFIPQKISAFTVLENFGKHGCLWERSIIQSMNVVFHSHLGIQGSLETHEPGGAGASWDPWRRTSRLVSWPPSCITWLLVGTLYGLYMLCFFPILVSRGHWRHMSLEEQELAEILEENITFGQLATFLHNMAACGNPLLTLHVVFLSHLGIQGSLETHEPGGNRSYLRSWRRTSCFVSWPPSCITWLLVGTLYHSKVWMLCFIPILISRGYWRSRS